MIDLLITKRFPIGKKIFYFFNFSIICINLISIKNFSTAFRPNFDFIHVKTHIVKKIHNYDHNKI